MLKLVRVAYLGLVFAGLAVGCGSGDGLTLAVAGGSVTLQGAPVAGANVTFVPTSGPIASAITDDQGKFKLSTGGRAGAPVGSCKVSVSLVAPSDDLSNLPPEEQTKLLTIKMGEKQGSFGEKEQKSLVPEKYSKADTSGLSFTVSANASENDFAIKLEP